MASRVWRLLLHPFQRTIRFVSVFAQAWAVVLALHYTLPFQVGMQR